MATKLTVDPQEFELQYTRRIYVDSERQNSYLELREKPSVNGLDCIFLDRTTIPGKALCKVHEVKPLQCRTWPFWSSVIESKDTWIEASRGPELCPGIGIEDSEGKHTYTEVEILDQMNETETWLDKLDENILPKGNYT